MNKDCVRWHALAKETAQLAEIARVLHVFHYQGIPSIALKGAALIGRVYQSGSRPMSDIDLLLRRENLDRAERLLQRLGYRFLLDSAGDTPAFARTYMGQVPYCRGPVTIELHHQLVASRWLREIILIDEDGIWERALPMEIDGALTLRLGVEDEIIHLCLHTAVHHGLAHQQGYKDIICVAQAEAANVDWTVLAHRARAWRVSVSCWAALSVTNKLAKGTVPQEALEALQVPTWRQWALRSFIASAVPGRPALVSGRMRFLGVLLVDRIRDLPKVVYRGLFPGRRWIETRFGLSPRAARWRQVTYPLEVLLRGCQAVWKASRPGARQGLVKK